MFSPWARPPAPLREAKVTKEERRPWRIPPCPSHRQRLGFPFVPPVKEERDRWVISKAVTSAPRPVATDKIRRGAACCAQPTRGAPRGAPTLHPITPTRPRR